MRQSIPRALIAPVIFFVVAACAQTESAADWPQWRGPAGNGISPETSWNSSSLDGEPKILWKASVGAGYSSVAVSGGLLYSIGNDRISDTVICLDADNGELVWSFSYECAIGSYPGPRSTPFVDGDIVYTLSREGHLFAFRAADGRIVWSRHLADDFRIQSPSWGFAGSPVIHGELLILNGGSSGFALDKKTGDMVWNSGRRSGGYATPVLFDYNGTAAAAIFGRRALYGVAVSDGEVLWSYPWVTGSDVNAADPVISNDTAFISSAYNHGSAAVDFSSEDVQLLWKNKVFQAHFSSFVHIDGYIYGSDGDIRAPTSGKFRCVDLKTGEVRWSERIGVGSLIAAGDRLIYLGSTGKITVSRATARRYEEIATSSLPRSQYWTPPALSNSRLYCRSVRGDLYCIDLR